jgi:hypothetical protein
MGNIQSRAARAANSECERRSARAIKAYTLFQAANSAAGAQRGAVQSRHGVGKLQHFAHRHSFQNSIAEGSVEDVAGAGGIHAVDHEGGRIHEAPIDARERPVRAERHRRHAHAVFVL